jgi:hypothetical protein
MSIISINATTERSQTLRGRSGVPWLTVVPLAALLAYADGFWIISLREAVGAIERTGQPFANWLRESTLALPLFVLAVLGALTLALRWFGPVLRSSKALLATALLVASAGTLVGIAQIVAGGAYDYHLQSDLLQFMSSTRHIGSPELFVASQEQASLGLQARALAYGSALLLVTNLVLVGWLVAVRRGQLDVSTTRPRAARTLPAGATVAADSPHSRVEDLRLVLAAGLVGSAAIHAAVIPQHLSEWAAAGVFFIVLTGAELAVAALLLARFQPIVLLAAAAVSIGPLGVWLYSRTLGLPFGPEAGVPEQVGLADLAACALEVATLLIAVVLLRASGWLRRPSGSAHVRGLAVVAVVAISAIGLSGSGLAWFDDYVGSADGSAAVSGHSGH